MIEKEELKREIGTWGLIANSVNIIIGAGIFMLPVIVAEKLGPASLSAYAICGALMILIMLCFAEVGSKITITGGAYTYIETTFGRFAGFLTANIFIFGAGITANAAVANGFADTLSYFFPVFKLQWFRVLFFAVLFGGLAFINVRGIKKALILVKFNTIAKLVPLVMIIAFGWFFISRGDIKIAAPDSVSSIGEVALILLFAFVGAETALNVSGEIRNPGKTVPKGIMGSIFIVVVLYILIQLVVQAILGESISLHGNAPLAETGRIMFGATGALIVIIGATFSMFGNISGMVMNMPRILYASARDMVIPFPALAKVSKTHKTPHVSIIVYAFIGFVFASAGEFKQLAMLSSASYMLIYLGVILSVIKFSTGQGSVNILKAYIIPAAASVVILWVLSNLPKNELIGMAIFVAILSLVYFIISKLRKIKAKDGQML
jgi:amino acid transporter